MSRRTPEPGDVYESPDRYTVVRRTTVKDLLEESQDALRNGRFYGPEDTGYYVFDIGEEPVRFGAGWSSYMAGERGSKVVILLARSYPRSPYKLRRP